MQTRFIAASTAAVNQHSTDRGAGHGDLSSGQAAPRIYRREQAAGGSGRRARLLNGFQI
jgi:hypothetical protein